MHIAYIIGQLRKGGAEQQLFSLATHLQARITVIVMEQNHEDGYWVQPLRDHGIEVIELPRRVRFDVHRVLSLRRLLRTVRPDIVHIFADNAAALYGRIAALMLPRIPVVVGVRRYPDDDPCWLYALKRYLLNRSVAALVANSQSTADFLLRHRMTASQRIHHIPNGIEVARFRKPAQPAWPLGICEDWRGRQIVGSVTSLLPKKNPALYVQVARNVLAELPDVRFLHVGKGRLLAEVQQRAQAAGIADKMHFLGERHDIPTLLHQMSLFVMTSNSEGTPNAAMEAMAAGLPCVLTDTGDCAALVKDSVSGYVVPVGDEAALTDAVLRLLQDDALRKQFGRAAAAYIESYDIQGMARQYMAVYQQVQQSMLSLVPSYE